MMRYLFVQAHFYKQISEDDDEVILRPHGFLVPSPRPPKVVSGHAALCSPLEVSGPQAEGPRRGVMEALQTHGEAARLPGILESLSLPGEALPFS